MMPCDNIWIMVCRDLLPGVLAAADNPADFMSLRDDEYECLASSA